MRRPLRLWPATVAVLALAGLALRIVLLRGRWGTLDSDEAIVGLMARGFRHGHWRAFYWGQHYGGTIETALVAAAGASLAALKLVPVVLSAIAAVLTWRVGRRVVDEHVAQAAGLLAWVAPGSAVWWSTKERGFYWASIVLGLVLLLAALRLAEGRRPVADGVLLGLAAGLGFWSAPAVLYYALPAGGWLLLRRRPPWTGLAAAVPAALVGATPWLWHNVGHGWPSLDRPEQPHHVSYHGGIGRLLWRSLPIVLNLREPITERWLVPVVAPLALVGLGAWLAVGAMRRPTRPTLVLAVLAVFPFVYAWFPGAWFVGEARYAVFAVPFLALAVAWLVRRPAALVSLAAVSVVLSFLVLRPIQPERPRHVAGDLAVLRRAGVDHAWADYWIAYRLDLASGGWLQASPRQSSRDRALHDAAAADPTPAFVFRSGDRRRPALEQGLVVPHHLVRTPHFVVVVADGRVDPRPLGALVP